MKSIGNYAFEGCESIVSVTIPASVKTIGNDAFGNCSNLTRVDISDIAAWCEIDFNGYFLSSNPLYYAHSLYLNGSHVKELTVPDGVKNINRFTFIGCDALSVTIPKSVTFIGGSAFYNCKELTDVYYAGMQTEWDNVTIENYNTSLTNAKIHFRGATTVTILNAATGIAVTYPNSSIPESATLSVEQVKGLGNYLVETYEKISAWNIKILVNGVETQPNTAVTVKIPIPEGYNEKSIAVYHVNSAGKAEKVEPIKVENGYITFSVTSFSIYIVVDESTKVSETETNPEDITENDNNDDNTDEPKGNACKYCGEVHEGFLGKIIGFFHSILALFGLRKK